MDKGVLFHADVNEGRLKTILQILNFALEDTADDAILGRPLDVELLEVAVFEDGDARLEALRVNDDFFFNFFPHSEFASQELPHSLIHLIADTV